MWKMILPGLILMTVATGCTGGTVTDAGCLAFRPIRPMASDIAVMSDRLVDQVLAHNETGSRVCGWRDDTTT